MAAWGFTKPEPHQIIPYLKEPVDVIPGLATWYATTCRECPAGCGMWVKTREGRPIKVEGNPNHPINRGALCARGQASLQGLYHPNRFRGPMVRVNGELKPISWDEGIKRLAGAISELRQKGKSDRIALVTGAVTGTLAGLMDQWLAALGAPKRITYEPLGHNSEREANRVAFGSAEIPLWRIDRAEYLVTFSSDFLETGPSPVEHGRFLAEARVRWGKGQKRFFAFSPRLDLTAANADEWIPIRPGTEGIVVMAILGEILLRGWVPSEGREFLNEAVREIIPRFFRFRHPEDMAKQAGIRMEQITALAKGLSENRPSVVIGGPFLDVETCKAIALLNVLLGNVNRTILFGTGTGADWATDSEMHSLSERMEKNEVELLLKSGSSEFYSPAEKNVPLKVALTSLPNGYTEPADLILPVHHFLEDWDAFSPRAGIVGLVQPGRQPMGESRPLGDILLQVAQSLGDKTFSDASYQTVQKAQANQAQSLNWWGIGGGTSWNEQRRNGGWWKDPASVSVKLQPEAFQISFPTPSLKTIPNILTLVPFASALLYDGRGLDRPWLRECPDPMSKITWEGWAELHPQAAAKWGLKSGDIIQIEGASYPIETPVWITPGIHPDVIAVPMGGNLILCRDPENSCPVQVKATGQSRPLALAQGADEQFGRGFARDTDYVEAHEERTLWEKQHVRPPARADLYPDFEYKEHHWEMVIDLDRCTGCSACVVACYAENNLPVVGRDKMLNRREMSWVRIERYYEKRGDELKALFVPMLCQQCDRAPCETVCPVFASYHTSEGLNAQIYNRCVGTRYCANNCPYKVRRFNWFTYEWTEPLNQQLNPEVTVREKGVMEKCTFCIQRIMAAKMKAKLEGRKLKDGDVIPACAQTCPTGAITFGDRLDPESRVSRLLKDERGYHVLEQLNTKPSITYLKRVARHG